MFFSLPADKTSQYTNSQHTNAPKLNTAISPSVFFLLKKNITSQTTTPRVTSINNRSRDLSTATTDSKALMELFNINMLRKSQPRMKDKFSFIIECQPSLKTRAIYAPIQPHKVQVQA
ncbi:uncharacterized protein A4U43_C07F38900 [Asparagus officinalis]|uniref:Uncharacterized protein n=1 Tax=Asparagus officinalis TaxID=4686 RepID=A0A5P1EI48_ASPOF|nr:uncharacterized protein A4U43_C07F38900 [Asparagus officinalis]